MSKKVLILTNSKDGEHTDSVVTEISRHGFPVFRFNSDSLSQGTTRVHFECSHSDRFRFTIENESGAYCSSDEVGSVWYRRPNVYDFPITDPEQRKFAKEELRSFLDGLWYSLDQVYWMSSPHALDRARKKALQLHIAQKVGFTIPETCITNSPRIATEFVESHLQRDVGGVIFKTLEPSTIEYNTVPYVIPASLITRQHLTHLEKIIYLPACFQERIHKKYELRVTIVGSAVFAVRINSQEFAGTSLDWRNADFLEKLHYEQVLLPHAIEEQCKVLMRELTLEFGALDFAVDEENNYIFFEINPNGQWYWLDVMAGTHIAAAIAKQLISGLSDEHLRSKFDA